MAKKQTKQQPHTIERAPIIAVMGHIDHGKSTLLDHIRETNVVSGEAGGITQHLSAYEIKHKSQQGTERGITFLDTPGHEAFEQMRSRGAEVADIAILVVSAEEGVKAQTMEAFKSIQDAQVPYIVAINKIDRPEANVEKTKHSLLENGIYLEGLGGDISWVPVSAITGEGINDLLDLVLLQAELQELTGDINKPAEGVVIEAHVDPKKGTSATLLIHDGTLRKGDFVVVNTCFAPVRIMENFLGEQIDEASCSSPVLIAGFNDVPAIGAPFTTVEKKKDAEKLAEANKVAPTKPQQQTHAQENEDTVIVPLIIKADVSGTIDAIEYSINQIEAENVDIRVIHRGVGNVMENDLKIASGRDNTIVLGFNVQLENSAKDAAERYGISVETFDIIYKLTEWLTEEIEKRCPRIQTEETTGTARVLKTFSKSKDKQVIGCRVEEGTIGVNQQCKIMRKGEEIARGTVINLQQQKADVQQVTDGEFGTQIQSKSEIASGDIIECFIVNEK